MRPNGFVRFIGAFFVAAVLAVTTGSFAFAADVWDTQMITVTGYGAPPDTAANMAQMNILGYRAAEVSAMRELAQAAGEVQLTSETTVRNAMIENDVINTRLQAIIRGARKVEQGRSADGSYWVKMEMPLFGATGSLASAVFDPNTAPTSFPEPVQGVAASEPNVNVNVTVNAGNQSLPLPSVPKKPTLPIPSVGGSSAAPAPVGRAIGGFTGLIVDCRGLGLRPVMSPVIRNETGAPIYGYKNLDSKKVIHSGMAGYVYDMSAATRAGSNPLIVKAIALEGHNGNPVVSTADANRILIENGASHFLDNTNVVFVR